MTFNEYQKKAVSFDHMKRETDIASMSFMAKILGLVGETGEFADKIKKILRNNGGEMSEYERKELLKELGDVQWYLAVVADYLGGDLQDIAEVNIAKLTDRKARNVIASKGDNR